MPNSRIIASALNGDAEELRRVVGPGSLMCIAPELSSVFVVRTAADGEQTATVALPGSTMFVQLPRSFQVRHIGHDSERFTLTSTDGRSVAGTPRQFTACYKVIVEKHNPWYEEHVEEAFLATSLLPDGLLPPHIRHVDTDPVLGEPRVEGRIAETSVTTPGRRLEMWFDCAGPEKIAELLPHARRLVAEFEHIRRDGTEFIWTTFAEGDETEEEKARFPEVMTPNTLVVYRSGDFEVHFGEPESRYFMDGYWPAVQYRADMTPVHVTVEA
ncbi:hypothetical protein F7Q99_29930 [Streptomyces kaniharaensis]|uniref:Uncharacterized protein n=1 Tax=Streptomyces kaniharaensis TaxID=212423 RepID=A0A6N7KXV1_9ACTN|nr:hypothetical protein [Streptomyces kaniharaensis]MQS16321.1 hypothetical protein [Streptomyces kaniharaensis]